ncbi:hypothetical protein F2Q69_00060985 [Brassica cretica]|uniref:Uncharacterized protein n=1 Tax=Brassica cretica TaxID=69181 RepID=A0A8S9RK90_BRACR|nr:hypothetical protein F2Q69_00060985 [Brassica cretica]
MVKTKFTRNGREVMIWGGALRTFDYGSEEAVQQSNKDGNGGGSKEVVQQSKKGGKGGDGSVSEPKRSAKKGGKCGASVSLSSPERSRKSKRVEGISMLASTEAWDTIWVACVISGEGYEVWDTIWWFNSVS